MKHLLVIGAGMADLPAGALGGRTPLEAARIPHADRMAREGRMGRARFGGEVPLLAVLGYDPRRGSPALASLEAAGRGIHLAAGETVFRANLATVADGRLADARAGGMRDEEATALCDALNRGLGEPSIRFVAGVGHRALMIAVAEGIEGAECEPPGRILGEPLADHWPRGPGAALLRGVMERSHRLLDGHEVNAVRRDLGENPANLAWLWGPGGTARLDPFTGRTHLRAALAGGVDLARGVARAAAMTVLEVPGATGDAESDLAGKARAAVAALEDHDLCVVHVQAAAVAGDAAAKAAFLERMDAEVTGPLLAAAQRLGARMALAADGAVSSEGRARVDAEVPVALWGPGFAPCREGMAFDEAHARSADLRFEAGHEMMEYFLEHR